MPHIDDDASLHPAVNEYNAVTKVTQAFSQKVIGLRWSLD